MVLLVKIVIGTIVLIAITVAMTSYLASVFADNSSLNKDPQITNTMDEAHKFSLRYNSTLVQNETIQQIQHEAIPRWNTIVWLEADPKVLLQIEKVGYLPYPGFGYKVYNVTSLEDKFAFSMNVFAGPRINATIYFKDHTIIKYPTLQTYTTLTLQHSIPKDSSMKLIGNSILNISTSLSSMQDNLPMRYGISGTLSSNANGSGIPIQPILINILWLEHPELYNRTEEVITNENGYYKFEDTLTLQEGTYKTMVKPRSNIYAGLNVTKDLFVHGHPMTSDQLITYLGIGIGTAVAVIGVIVKVPSYFTATKQSNNLSTYISKVNKKYNEFNGEKSIDKNQFIQDLENIRSNITYLLERRDLSENQYKMIDDKIAYYLDKVAKSPGLH